MLILDFNGDLFLLCAGQMKFVIFASFASKRQIVKYTTHTVPYSAVGAFKVSVSSNTQHLSLPIDDAAIFTQACITVCAIDTAQ